MKSGFLLVSLLVLVISCDDIIEVDDITNQTVTVLAPVDGVTLDEGTILFSWNAIEDAESYRVQIVTPNFDEAAQILTDSTVTNTYLSMALETGDYQWRVRAENSGYDTGYTTQGFLLSATEPVDISGETIVVIAPSNNAVFSPSDTINFSWEAVAGVDEYVIQIVAPNFDAPVETIENDTTTSTNFSISGLDESTYEFRIKAKNISYETDYTIIGFSVSDD